MKKLARVLVALVPLLVASEAYAAAQTCAKITGASNSILCTCASGTCDAPTGTPASPAGGMRITSAITAVDIMLCPTTAGANITAGKVNLWIYDNGKWALFNASVYTTPVGAADTCVMVQGDSPGKGIPIIGRRGWLFAVPTGTTTSAGGVSTAVLASGPSGSL